ncbi:hypothetical protein A9Q83_15395 [Alphaproteobacteria bacterium 46_93_T64]|nr:hypothetical protein A9Q83_15395 [Alphaproteobacteria bacterium 46_93_T64]
MKSKRFRCQWKHVFAIAAIAVALCMGSIRFSYAQKLVFLADNYPPYEFVNLSGEAHGFDVEVIQAVFKHLNIPISIEFRPWKRVVESAKSGNATGMFSCGHSVEREEFFRYSTPISYTTQGVIVKKNRSDFQISTREDLKKMNIGSIAGYASNKHLEELEIPYFKIPLLDNAFPMLRNDRIDGLFLTMETGQFLAVQEGMISQLDFIPLIDLASRPYHLCFSKKWPGTKELLKRFNQGFRELQKNGKVAEIHARYR